MFGYQDQKLVVYSMDSKLFIKTIGILLLIVSFAKGSDRRSGEKINQF